MLHSDLLRLFLPEAVIYFRSALRRNGRHALILHSLSACLWCCSPATLTSVSACVIHQSIFGLTHFSASSVLDACTLSAVSSELIRQFRKETAYESAARGERKKTNNAVHNSLFQEKSCSSKRFSWR